MCTTTICNHSYNQYLPREAWWFNHHRRAQIPKIKIWKLKLSTKDSLSLTSKIYMTKWRRYRARLISSKMNLVSKRRGIMTQRWKWRSQGTIKRKLRIRWMASWSCTRSSVRRLWKSWARNSKHRKSLSKRGCFEFHLWMTLAICNESEC